MSASDNTIHASHELAGDSEKLEKYYADWAAKYDDDVRNEEYGGPRAIASIALMVADSFLGKPAKSIRVLDAGCGTGLAGIELKMKGFDVIDGFDLSQEMCDIAEKTEAYAELAGNVDLNRDDKPVFNRTYDLIVCCGVFTLGHVEPEALTRLAEYLSDDGYMVVSTRNSYLEDTDYEDVGKLIEKQGTLHLVTKLPDARYIAEEDAHYWVYGKGRKAS
ncbi:class I SAM-dependent DNA methyltransferase [Jiella marina]|uniref:class I SAM-dependent DNA methyltransferase n=1 Tax=Jiella sp. LLJ827 TaxID=2917712 RepID=UPI002100788E|nr:class I SAM-dependent methyltransferase [Jiella sp. LLJ827]MCQ0987852.1 class I SAM-dependent methyltransferase [Jiella sp. LLJ827]